MYNFGWKKAITYGFLDFFKKNHACGFLVSYHWLVLGSLVSKDGRSYNSWVIMPSPSHCRVMSQDPSSRSRYPREGDLIQVLPAVSFGSASATAELPGKGLVSYHWFKIPGTPNPRSSCSGPSTRKSPATWCTRSSAPTATRSGSATSSTRRDWKCDFSH